MRETKLPLAGEPRGGLRVVEPLRDDAEGPLHERHVEIGAVDPDLPGAVEILEERREVGDAERINERLPFADPHLDETQLFAVGMQ